MHRENNREKVIPAIEKGSFLNLLVEYKERAVYVNWVTTQFLIGSVGVLVQDPAYVTSTDQC
jgi:hypothetical protein